MLQRAASLDEPALTALARLEAATVAHDGGRLKLEWGVLRARSGDEVEDLLWWDGDTLVGFTGIYAFGWPTVEITGMVDPAHRRRGIGAALLEEAVSLQRAQGTTQLLMVVPRASQAGAALAASRGGVLEHSEHAMALRGEVADGAEDPTLSLRPATSADVPDVARVLSEAFGNPWRPSDLEAPGEPTLVAERDGAIVATCRVHQDPQSWGVYGLAVDRPHQGRGIGRDLLRRVCRQARSSGVDLVTLEVSVDNDRALGLYTSLGFEGVTTEDYYELPLEDAARRASTATSRR